MLVDSAQPATDSDLQNDPLVARALQGQYASRIDTTSETPTVSVAMPVLVDGQTIGVAYLSQSLRDVLTVLNDLRVRLLLSTLIALALSAFVGWWLSRRITRPVQQLTTAAEAVAAGHFDQAVQVNSRDELGRLSHTFNDMTTRLQAARQMQVDFVADVSHELRTPLTSIKGTIETLRDGAVNDLDVRDRFLETVETETDRLIRLVNDLLVLSRVDSAALNLSRKPTDMGQLVQALADRLAEQAQRTRSHHRSLDRSRRAPRLGRCRSHRASAAQSHGQRDQVFAPRRIDHAARLNHARSAGAGSSDR